MNPKATKTGEIYSAIDLSNSITNPFSTTRRRYSNNHTTDFGMESSDLNRIRLEEYATVGRDTSIGHCTVYRAGRKW